MSLFANSIQDVNDAQASFDIARFHCKDFAFVHIAYAQFELLQGKETLVTSVPKSENIRENTRS